MGETPDVKTTYFETVNDMHAVPLEKVDAFCEDLRLWLRTHRMVDGLGPDIAKAVQVRTPTHRFGWIDDGEHNVNLKIEVVDKLTPKKKPS
jgi:hypothetical protein